MNGKAFVFEVSGYEGYYGGIAEYDDIAIKHSGKITLREFATFVNKMMLDVLAVEIHECFGYEIKRLSVLVKEWYEIDDDDDDKNRDYPRLRSFCESDFLDDLRAFLIDCKDNNIEELLKYEGDILMDDNGKMILGEEDMNNCDSQSCLIFIPVFLI